MWYLKASDAHTLLKFLPRTERLGTERLCCCCCPELSPNWSTDKRGKWEFWFQLVFFVTSSIVNGQMSTFVVVWCEKLYKLKPYFWASSLLRVRASALYSLFRGISIQLVCIIKSSWDVPHVCCVGVILPI